MIKIRNLSGGCIIWDGNCILGITDVTLPERYYDCYCTKIHGNSFDYEIVKEDDDNEEN